LIKTIRVFFADNSRGQLFNQQNEEVSIKYPIIDLFIRLLLILRVRYPEIEKKRKLYSGK